MNNGPVNSLSLEMCKALSERIHHVEQDKSMKGLVLTSAFPSTFSAGLNLMELYRPNPDRLCEFWTSVQQLYIDLYGTRLAVVAAINGHAPAAGCMLAMACDYRIMKNGPARIGLNEASFGLVAPEWMGGLMLRTVGHREGEIALGLGKLYSPEEAKQVGLVDELLDGVETNEALVETAQGVAAQWAKIPQQARAASKMIARGPYLKEVHASRQKDLEQFVSFNQNEKVQMALGMYLKSLNKK
eukprot:CAMPEP_0118676832 /NCGR_PEP_ID=MMETSP0800-20121206/2271_1 /TAXON_ID=210618 ORGANISM="Striatella unipunctata, Strain CCMP2910" /NCGR_SAMPLE_ID=MMETSP0800 /ASSEMBLY_ACC=CAM_ASM_000638 /LENGTH=242 /DNA_ID=CAMNT_0006572399 /DNA_START=164 /DNA_END=892 /DNA_ORIENTATION=-